MLFKRFFCLFFPRPCRPSPLSILFSALNALHCVFRLRSDVLLRYRSTLSGDSVWSCRTLENDYYYFFFFFLHQRFDIAILLVGWLRRFATTSVHCWACAGSSEEGNTWRRSVPVLSSLITKVPWIY